MKRLLRISLDTLLTSTLPIIMWILLGIIVNKNITNVFTLTYPIQFVITLLISIFGTGANINATKSNRNNLIDSNIVLGSLVGGIITFILCLKVNLYIEYMSMDVEMYRTYCIYSFILMYLQLILQLVSQKLYYMDENKKSNKLTIFFNITNIILIVLLSFITKDNKISVITTLLIDSIILLFILSSFLPTPFCTYIGQLGSMLYQIFVFNIMHRNKYYIDNELLKMKENL